MTWPSSKWGTGLPLPFACIHWPESAPSSCLASPQAQGLLSVAVPDVLATLCPCFPGRTKGEGRSPPCAAVKYPHLTSLQVPYRAGRLKATEYFTSISYSHPARTMLTPFNLSPFRTRAEWMKMNVGTSPGESTQNRLPLLLAILPNTCHVE